MSRTRTFGHGNVAAMAVGAFGVVAVIMLGGCAAPGSVSARSGIIPVPSSAVASSAVASSARTRARVVG